VLLVFENPAWLQVLMSNVGGTATMVGDPPNIIIGTALQRYLGFVDFIIHLAPGVICASIPAVAMIMWLYRADLMGDLPDYARVLKAVQEYRITDWDLMAKSGEHGAVGGTPVGLFRGSVRHTWCSVGDLSVQVLVLQALLMVHEKRYCTSCLQSKASCG
jgi:hypothetical protein